jgi:hypothetical protein
MLEVVLNYRSPGFADGTAIAVARSEDSELIQAVAAKVLQDAEREAVMWQRVDPALGAMQRAQVGRLTAILGQRPKKG